MLSLVQFRRDRQSATRVGVWDGVTVRTLEPIVAISDLMEMLDQWARWSVTLRDLDVTALPVIGDAEVIAPLTFPRKVLCAGANYFDHAQEMNVARPDPDLEPFFFLKTPTTTVVGPFADIRIGADPSDCFDWEAELGVVIGFGARDVPVESAMELVAGYVVANDISARGLFARRAQPPFDWNWLGQKNKDDSCPMGPGVVPKWLITDPHNLTIRLEVNGAVKQQSSTSRMVVDIPHLIAGASRMTTLEAGDVILTGTPAGVGLPRNTFLHPGDVVTVTIEGVGHIRNRIVAREAPLSESYRSGGN